MLVTSALKQQIGTLIGMVINKFRCVIAFYKKTIVENNYKIP